MFGRKKLLEEKIGAAIEAEFEGLVAELERDLADYRRRSRNKEKARIALEEAEAEARRVHLERVALKKRFWEAYYGNDEATLKKIEPEHRSLTRATRRAEKSLRKARENFGRADFDEAAEGAALKKKAYAAAEKADLRISALEEAVEELQGKGVEVVDGITDHPWGRIAAFKDPDGNSLELFEPPKS